MAKATAIQKLQPSSLATGKQLELLGGDVDLTDFTLQMRDKAGIKLISAITGATVERTIEGASTLTVTVDDAHKEIQNSGRLGRRVDVHLNGLWFTLVQVKKSQRELTLTFEEREVNLLRYYSKFIMASRDQATRAEFVLRMIKEVKEVSLKWVIPELHVKQTVADVQTPNQVLIDTIGNPLISTDDEIVTSTQRDQGIAADHPGLTVKGKPATPEQIKNAETILRKGAEMHATRKVMVCSIMTAIDESELVNLFGGDLDSVGIFQQRRSQGWPATRDIPTDAAAFFESAKQIDKNYPDISYNDLCQKVQNSGTPFAYGQYQPEAEKYVQAFGIAPPGPNSVATINNTVDAAVSTIQGVGGYAGAAGGTASDASLALGGNYYTRGTLSQKGTSYILTKENSWNCMQRLAQEVNFRCFCVSGIIYYISEKWLFRSKPFMTISEETKGVDYIDFDYDEGKRSATVTVTCHLGRWSAPPGSIVQIKDEGIVSGRWLVNDVTRSLFDTDGVITLKKPLPILPEPTKLVQLPTGFLGPSNVGPNGRGINNSFNSSGPLTQPVPKSFLNSVGPPHATDGLPGYEAYDYMAKAGSPVIAVEHGTIERWSGHNPAQGPTSGVHGPFGWSIYLKGDSGSDYYYTHLGTRSAQPGDEVNIGQQIGTIGDYAKWGGADHVHFGTHPGANGHPDFNDILNSDPST